MNGMAKNIAVAVFEKLMGEMNWYADARAAVKRSEVEFYIRAHRCGRPWRRGDWKEVEIKTKWNKARNMMKKKKIGGDEEETNARQRNMFTLCQI